MQSQGGQLACTGLYRTSMQRVRTQQQRKRPITTIKHSTTETTNNHNKTFHSHNTHLTALCPGLPVSCYQKGNTNLDFTEATDSEWQWHQLGHMQVCTSLQTDNHASTPPLNFFTGRMLFLPPNQQRQSTEGKFHSHNN